jgi:hypothetical protein
VSALRRAGAIVQGIVVGILLAVALLNLAALGAGAQLFRYQGF